MKKIYYSLVVAYMLATGTVAVAQTSVVLNTNGLPNQNALIRTWVDNYSIGYVDGGRMQQGYFFVEDIASRHLRVVPLLPDVEVHDFEVLDDKVFFCGEHNGLYIGVVGWFDINNVFYMSGSIQYGGFPSASRMTSLSRLDVYYFNGIYHMALIGEMQIPGGTSVTTVCDVYDSAGVWKANYLNNAAGLISYTDIAVDGNHVVAAAKKSYSDDNLVSIYKISSNFLSTPIPLVSKYILNGDTPLDDILVEAVGSDMFVLAYYYDSLSYAGTEYAVFSVDAVTDMVSPLYYWQIEHGASTMYSGWKLRELKYDPVAQNLLLLHDVSCSWYTGIKSVVFSHDVLVFSSGYIKWSYTPGMLMHGMDRLQGGFYQTIGVDPVLDYLTINHEWVGTLSMCREDFKTPNRLFHLSIEKLYYPDDVNETILTPGSSSEEMFEIQLGSQCERKQQSNHEE